MEADNPSAFASGILEGLRNHGRFDPAGLRRRITGRFGREAWRARALSLCTGVVSGNLAEARAGG